MQKSLAKNPWVNGSIPLDLTEDGKQINRWPTTDGWIRAWSAWTAVVTGRSLRPVGDRKMYMEKYKQGTLIDENMRTQRHVLEAKCGCATNRRQKNGSYNFPCFLFDIN